MFRLFILLFSGKIAHFLRTLLALHSELVDILVLYNLPLGN